MTQLQTTRSRREQTSLRNVEVTALQTLAVAESAVRSEEATCEASTAPQPAAVQVSGLRRVVYIAVAFAFLGLGFLGAFLPGLPTTPFLLLTSYFLVRSSPRLHAKVTRMPIVGRFLNDWREKRGIRPRVKLLAAVIVLAVLAASLSISLLPTAWKVVIAGLGAIGLTVIFRLPTIRE